MDTAEQLLAATELERTAEIDLAAVDRVDPYGVLLATLIVAHHRERGVHLSIRWPRRPSVRRELEQMGFAHAVGRDAGAAPRVTETTVPVAAIRRESEISAIVEAFDRRLQECYPLTDASRQRLVSMLFELFQNIPHHCNATGEVATPMGMAAMRDDEDEIELAVVDKGIGLRRSLALRPGFADLTDASAVNRIVFDGMSRHIDPGRGGELRRIAKLVRTWQGTLAIRTGDALLHMDAERGDVYDSPPFPGVQIGVRLPRRVLGIEEPPS